MRSLFDTDAGWPGLIVRLGVGIVMFPHGMQKAFGWFGGPGLAATYHGLTQNQHIPAVIAVLVILAESAGSIGLIVGCLTRIAALGLLSNMVGAIALVHWSNGFFMNWMGQQQGEGFEYHILVVAITIALMIKGGGKWSLDGAITGEKK